MPRNRGDNTPSFSFNNSPNPQVQQIGEIGQLGQLNFGTSQPSHQKSREQQEKILFLAADPYARVRLRLDLEMKAVGDALRSSGLEEKVALEGCMAPTFLDLQHALLRHRPSVLHFSGHGTPSGELTLEKDPQVPPASIRPETSDQRPAEALARLLGAFDDLKVRCVVLNACFSETQASEIAKQVECVVGLTAEVHDSAAIEFARGFYGAIAWGQSVQAAFSLGVAQVRSQNDAGQYRLIASLADPRTVKVVKSSAQQVSP